MKIKITLLFTTCTTNIGNTFFNVLTVHLHQVHFWITVRIPCIFIITNHFRNLRQRKCIFSSMLYCKFKDTPAPLMFKIWKLVLIIIMTNTNRIKCFGKIFILYPKYILFLIIQVPQMVTQLMRLPLTFIAPITIPFIFIKWIPNFNKMIMFSMVVCYWLRCQDGVCLIIFDTRISSWICESDVQIRVDATSHHPLLLVCFTYHLK